MNAPAIPTFLERIRDRLNLGAVIRISAAALLAVSLAAVSWALAWRIFGYAAPAWGYVVAIVIGAISAIAWIFASLSKTRDAAVTADAVFHLKDGLISWLDFQTRDEEREALRLHEISMTKKLAALDPKSVALPKPKRTFAAGGLLALAAIVLALLPHGESVRKRLALEELTLQRSAIVSKEMEQAVEELIKQLSTEEKELLDDKKLREWAKEIEQTKDPRQAEKQLAKIEQEIAQTMQGLEARQDEAVLKLAGEELEKSSSAELRQLGKQLDMKDFEKAAEQMKNMKPAADKKMTAEELKALKENAAKSREMAKRMADGAKKRDFGKNNNDGKMGAMKPSDGNQRPMQDMLNDLDANANKLDKELADAAEMDDEIEGMAQKVEGEMGELGKRLGKLGARSKAKGKLNALRQGLAQARQFSQGSAQSAGLAQSQMQSDQPGGKRPGVGSSESRRNERDELKDNGNRAEVKGQDNPDGPSTNSIETAESGTGVAGRSNVAKDREFRQQYESLVHRDDIPESLKLGIREYFEKVHETQPETK